MIMKDQNGNEITTLRDYFAGQALIGFLSGHKNIHLPEIMAGNCYMYADAMIKERDK